MNQSRSEIRPIKHDLRAYTLVELLIVVVIMGIVAAVAIPSFGDSIAEQHVAAAAERIRADLELARQHAITTAAFQTVKFDATGYGLPGMEDFDHPGQAYEVDLSSSEYGATIVSVDFGGDATVVFDGYGMPDSGGSVVIKVGNQVRTISVDQGSRPARVLE